MALASANDLEALVSGMLGPAAWHSEPKFLCMTGGEVVHFSVGVLSKPVCPRSSDDGTKSISMSLMKLRFYS